MHLNEFADPKIYALPADDVANIIKQLETFGSTMGLKMQARISSVRESRQRTGE